MPGRWSEYDTDAERLPEGMQRIGYDADDQTYTFRDADGSIWESAPGNRYGQLRRVTTTLPSYGDDEEEEASATQPLNPFTSEPTPEPASWRQEMMPLLNWFLLIGVCLLAFFWYLTRGTGGGNNVVSRKCAQDDTPYVVTSGDTCWAIAEAKSVPLEVLTQANEGIDCDLLVVGETICIPTL
ncbi:carbohydrate-binding module family 50 protein [Xylariaceae sp. FL0255]|nr:carbohydrate-binding module family 50 protein [Xylariaceae sp. FL0255]